LSDIFLLQDGQFITAIQLSQSLGMDILTKKNALAGVYFIYFDLI